MTGPSIAIIDYEMGNLHSACKGLEKVGADVTVVDRPHHLEQFDGLVLPGVGAFDPAIGSLRKHGFEEPIREAIARRQPLLGICLGLQLLFESSTEGVEPGLGLIPGTVERFQPEPNLTIPHMGWNTLEFVQPGIPLWSNLDARAWVYFVHSYYVCPNDNSWTAATVTHGTQTVTAAIARDMLMATQFHPEKSAGAGLQILANFVQLVKTATPQTVLAR
ncbi:MAG: imidazole glycerol phosphate synthase subunit HisH [Cyanobacteria bacterium P01_D01_bin.123]